MEISGVTSGVATPKSVPGNSKCSAKLGTRIAQLATRNPELGTRNPQHATRTA